MPIPGQQIVFEAPDRKASPEDAPAPAVSVVVMLRNEAPTLPVLLDSLERQETPFLFEVLFVDGNSEDGSLEVITRHPLTSKVPTTIVTLPPENCGMVVAQNVGAELARGEILLFTQADVRVRDPGAIAEVRARFDDEGVVGTRFIGLGPQLLFHRYDFWGKVFMARYVGDRVEDDFDLKWNGVRRDVFFEVGAFDDERLPLGGNDFEFETRLLAAGKIVPTAIEAEHLHGLGKEHRPWGLIKKYCRNSEVAGATASIYFRNRSLVSGYWFRTLQQAGVVAACLAALVPPLWPWSPILVLLLGAWHQKAAYRHVRSWRLAWLPAFGVVVLFAFAYFFVAGLLRGRTVFEFDNKMS